MKYGNGYSPGSRANKDPYSHGGRANRNPYSPGNSVHRGPYPVSDVPLIPNIKDIGHTLDGIICV